MAKLISFYIDAQRFFQRQVCLTENRLIMSGLRLSFIALMILGVATLTLAQRPSMPTRSSFRPNSMMGGNTGRQFPGSMSQGFPNFPFPLSDDWYSPMLAYAFSLGSPTSGRSATAGSPWNNWQALAWYQAMQDFDTPDNN